MDLFKKLNKQNEEFRKGLNPFRNTGCCGGRPSKKNKYRDIYYTSNSQDDITNF